MIWGHEHECLIDPKEGPEGKSFHVIQPGSTVATSLIPSEAVPKHMGLLEVKGMNFRVTPIPLKMVSPEFFSRTLLFPSMVEGLAVFLGSFTRFCVLLWISVALIFAVSRFC